MKRFLTFFTLLLLAQSCTKEADVSFGADTSSEAISFTASLLDMTGTKATLINSWSSGEQVALFVEGDDNLYHFTIAADGTMSGDDVIVDRTIENTYRAFYPYDATLSSIEEYEAACSAGEVDYMSAETTTSGAEVNLQFSHSLAALSFTVIVEQEEANMAISLALDGNFNSAIALEVASYTATGASKFVANYFMTAGTDISSAMVKLEQSGSSSIHPIKREDTNTLEAGKQYPFSYTIGEIPTGLGQGTEENPYVIYTADDMRKVGTDTDGWSMSSHYLLAWDIDLGGEEFSAIGTSPSSLAFTGSFDGAGYEISGLYINQPSSDYQALFGYIYGATIKDLGVSGSVSGKDSSAGVVGYAKYSTLSGCHYSGSVVGSGRSVGGVVGELRNTTISDCYNTGSIVGSNYYVGGVVGLFTDYSTMSGCYNTGSIKGSSDFVGGVTGHNSNYSTVSDCYNTGSIEGSSDYVGGVTGGNNNYSTVSDCYNTGSIEGSSDYVGGVTGCNNDYSTVSDCYNLVTAYSGEAVGYNDCTVENVSSKTASEMTSTDFVTLLNGDGGTVWVYDTKFINSGYPILSWQ